MACWAASLTKSGAGKFGKPWPRFTAPVWMAKRSEFGKDRGAKAANPRSGRLELKGRRLWIGREGHAMASWDADVKSSHYSPCTRFVTIAHNEKGASQDFGENQEGGAKVRSSSQRWLKSRQRSASMDCAPCDSSACQTVSYVLGRRFCTPIRWCHCQWGSRLGEKRHNPCGADYGRCSRQLGGPARAADCRWDRAPESRAPPGVSGCGQRRLSGSRPIPRPRAQRVKCALAIVQSRCTACHQSRISVRRGKHMKTSAQIQAAPSLTQTTVLACSTPRR